ncbi:flagellar assembly protein H [Microcystis aeruginosa str. Chao 1910]|uniref:flagellar assembly protein H n=1 Tax=Microcystis aeruginosa TaxID=1126 RepID=UPI002247F919|nr:flagellar assembly protein H [Microcystis aeruginosa]UZO76611.1 flagellar assembly protein H [Microcystis aeruginosa str. Chao 1910]
MKPHDQFAKNYLEQLLSPLGIVEISKEVSDETRQIDLFFSPNAEPNPDDLGLLGRIVLNTVLIEPYRNPPNRSEIRNCLAKLLAILAELQRQAKRENQSYNEDNAPRLWILSPSVGITVIEGFGAKLEPEWPEGVYFLPSLYRTAIIAINQLPVTAETLWLRLLGRGKTQNQAVRELLELPQGNAFRENVLELLISWRVNMEINNILETEDREVFMTLSQTYQEWKEATKREGRLEGKLEGKLESIPRLLALGLSVEQIAQALDLDLEQVRQAIQETP